MDEKMMEALQHLDGEKTIYYKKREFVPDELDLCVYKVASGYFKTGHNEDLDGYEKYYEMLRCWWYALIRLKEEELSEAKNEEASACFQAFYDIFTEVTNGKTQEEKMKILYRFPWHARVMLYAYQSSTKEKIAAFIHGVAGAASLTSMNFGDMSYMAISDFDAYAIDTIYDDIQLGNSEKLSYQLKENLHTVVHSYEYFAAFSKKGKEPIAEKDRHGYNIFAYLFLKHRELTKEGKIDIEQFEFFLHTYASLCFWHFEAETIQPTWFVKQGKFRHLKEIRKKLLGFI